MLFIKEISLFNFRNYEEKKFQFSANVCQIIGKNGSGKTNLLDAVYYLAFTKSAFNALDKFVIKKGANYFVVNGLFQNNNELDFVSCGLTSGKKNVLFNKKPYDKLSNHIGKLPIVLSSPYDLDLIREHGEYRRKLMDGIISQIDAEYLEQLIKYKSTLNQRNSLLKNCLEDHSKPDLDLLSIYNKELIASGTKIMSSRNLFCNSFLDSVKKAYDTIAQSPEKIKIIYQQSVKIEDFEQKLNHSLAHDLALGRTGFGPHKDDLLFLIQGTSASKYGSQGQQKTFTLAIRIAQFMYLQEHLQKPPIFLIDDLGDRLDKCRIKNLIELINNKFFNQVLVTNTEKIEGLEGDVIEIDLIH